MTTDGSPRREPWGQVQQALQQPGRRHFGETGTLARRVSPSGLKQALTLPPHGSRRGLPFVALRAEEQTIQKLLRPLLYLWASPGSLVGLLLTPLALVSGGGARVVEGVLEVHGGWVTRLLSKPFWFCGPIAAITLGHVVLGCDEPTLERTRRHERVHVRQYERWGPFFIPAYLLASGWLMLRGYNAYLDNPFEMEAYAVDDPRHGTG